MKTKKTFLIFIILLIVLASLTFYKFSYTSLPVVAIANYGPHSSLEDSIKGIKEGLAAEGYIEGQNIAYKISDVGFDTSLIPQMVTSLKASNPKVIVAMTTPVAQITKQSIKNIPIIYNVVTDPVEAGLLKNYNAIENNATCTSDKQDISLLLKFAKTFLPNAKRVGVLYSTSESNDAALIKMLKLEAEKEELEVMAIAVDQARDIPIRMQILKNKVDFIYVGTSGPIQPALPTIISQADKMMIPVFNANEEAVYQNQALASFGVNYTQIGKNTGKMIANILKTGEISSPLYPKQVDHQAFISKKKAEYFGITIPTNLKNITVIE